MLKQKALSTHECNDLPLAVHLKRAPFRKANQPSFFQKGSNSKDRAWKKWVHVTITYFTFTFLTLAIFLVQWFTANLENFRNGQETCQWSRAQRGSYRREHRKEECIWFNRKATRWSRNRWYSTNMWVFAWSVCMQMLISLIPLLIHSYEVGSDKPSQWINVYGVWECQSRLRSVSVLRWKMPLAPRNSWYWSIWLSIRYGPRQMKKPSFTGKGVLNCEIKFATFSCKKRRAYQRVRFGVVGLVWFLIVTISILT
jgi:hypothetical protein